MGMFPAPDQTLSIWFVFLIKLLSQCHLYKYNINCDPLIYEYLINR